MNTRKIHVGDKLALKPERAKAYGMAPVAPARVIVIEVASISLPIGELTPWIYDANNYAFRPSDFLKRIFNNDRA